MFSSCAVVISSNLIARPDELGASCRTRPLALNGLAEARGLKQASLCTYPAAQFTKNLHKAHYGEQLPLSIIGLLFL